MTSRTTPTTVDDLSHTAVVLFVAGLPAPQGSKRYLGHRRPVEDSAGLPSWRADVREALAKAWRTTAFDGREVARAPLQCAVQVGLEFVLRRPASTPKRRTPPAVRRPDLDKLARAVLDAITSAGVWADDAQVIQLHASKRLAEPGEHTGCHIRITPITQEA
ncbi:RusA family crossover junction endodeoxyribonuclease [Crossiella sp. SN42]|uniref:RusA family crossover junction endodeoxyribonuclease n=1 Tax=Crossiella sp. SN42 TaxID=2944808 RepID=UPI00207C2E7B|nr:RusA family crossover junction endodeoxyribonuclease [Crossiella sp. SN42]MCO1575007.1 RusA family crossover junction endodeoxyribonuclease [Crossiella sp. SN42]